MIKTITLKRGKKGKVHTTHLREEVSLHIEIVEKVYNRCINRGIMIDIDSLIDTVTDKGF